MGREPLIVLFADVLVGFGGIETYLDALARTLHVEGRRFKVAVCLNGPTPFLDDLEAMGIEVDRQPRVPGDRFLVRQRLLVHRVARALHPGDWVFCVRQPMAGVYPHLVRAVHARGAKVAASWIYAPRFLPPPPGRSGRAFCRAVARTDAVVSVSHCTRGEFAEVYGYRGPVSVVRYHNSPLFDRPVPLPPTPPYAVGFMGRIDVHQKNLDTVIEAMRLLRTRRRDVVLNLHGGGPDIPQVAAMIEAAGLGDVVTMHGRYDHRSDLPGVVAASHVFLYTSRFEGGPCLSLVELLSAGRYVVASPVGGIPDLYAGRSDLGLLVPSDDPSAIADGIEAALGKVASGDVDPRTIRHAYDAEYCLQAAHRDWLATLRLDRAPPPPPGTS